MHVRSEVWKLYSNCVVKRSSLIEALRFVTFEVECWSQTRLDRHLMCALC